MRCLVVLDEETQQVRTPAESSRHASPALVSTSPWAPAQTVATPSKIKPADPHTSGFV